LILLSYEQSNRKNQIRPDKEHKNRRRTRTETPPEPNTGKAIKMVWPRQSHGLKSKTKTVTGSKTNRKEEERKTTAYLEGWNYKNGTREGKKL
jgi:hypothetical protein